MRAQFIDPGAFRTELSLQKPVATPDGMGGRTESWQEVATVMAHVEPGQALSRFGAGQTLETVTHRITMRFRDGIASGMRFARGGRQLEILTVHDPDETGRYLVCAAREKGR